MEPGDSKAWAWKYVTADEILCQGACELSCILLTAKTAACVVNIYNGVDANGRKICKFKALANRSDYFHFEHEVYCEIGLYIDVDANTDGLFVHWRPVPKGEGG